MIYTEYIYVIIITIHSVCMYDKYLSENQELVLEVLILELSAFSFVEHTFHVHATHTHEERMCKGVKGEN